MCPSKERLGWLALEKVIFFVLLIPIRVENQLSKRSVASNSVYGSVPMALQFRVIKCEPNLAVCNSGDGNVLADTRTSDTVGSVSLAGVKTTE